MRDVMSLAETLTQAHERGEESVITAYCAAISSVDRAIAKHHWRHGQPCTSFCQPLGTAGVGRNIGLMTMELFTPARDVLRSAPSVGWRVEGGFKE